MTAVKQVAAPALTKKTPKRKLRTRWRQHERYGQLMFPLDKKDQAPGLIRFLYAEPFGYHKGALVRGATPLTERTRALIRKERAKTRKKLDSLRAVAS